MKKHATFFFVMLCFVLFTISEGKGIYADINVPDLTSVDLIFYLGYSKIVKSDSVYMEFINSLNEIIKVTNIAELKQLNPFLLETKFIYLEGLSNANDGGQGYLWVERINNVNKYNKVDNVLVYRSSDKKYYFKRIHSGKINLKLAGAKGDGVTDDVEAIQQVLDTKMDVSADSPNDVFLVGQSKKDRKIYYPYMPALIMYSGQSVNLNGSTLKLMNSCNCSVIINEALYKKGSTDKDISIHDGIIDGNADHQKITNITNRDQFSPTLYMGNLQNACFYNLKINNYYCAGLYITERNGQSVKNIRLDNIVVDKGKGPGIAINGEYYSGKNIRIYKTESFMENNEPKHYWGAYPNAITLDVDNSSFGEISYKNCSWGFKLQDGSKNVTFKKIVADGVLHGQAIKFQGKKTDEFYHYNDNISVDEIVSKNNNYNGLYIIYTKQIDIKSYIGIKNGKAYLSKINPQHINRANFYDVYILWSNVTIDRIESTNARMGVIDSRNMFAVGDNFRRFGKVIVKDLQNGYVANFKSSANTIKEINITANSKLEYPIVYMYGGDKASKNNETIVESVISNQQMSWGKKPFHVYRVGIGEFFRSRYVKLGNSVAFSVTNNKHTLLH